MPSTYAIPRINRVSGVERAYPVWPMSEVAGVPKAKPPWMAKSLWIEAYGIANYNCNRTPKNTPPPDTLPFKAYLEKCLADTGNVIEG